MLGLRHHLPPLWVFPLMRENTGLLKIYPFKRMGKCTGWYQNMGRGTLKDAKAELMG